MHRCREIPCSQRKMTGINPKAIWLMLKFMQINDKIDGTGKDQTQLHPTTKINYASEDQINFQICEINLLMVKIKPCV